MMEEENVEDVVSDVGWVCFTLCLRFAAMTKMQKQPACSRRVSFF